MKKPIATTMSEDFVKMSRSCRLVSTCARGTLQHMVAPNQKDETRAYGREHPKEKEI